MTSELLSVSSTASPFRNKLRSEDRAVHDWYRFVLSFPPHLVRDYLSRLDVEAHATVLDPFCGTGTTLVECKKLGIKSVGIESNPMAHFASSVKVDWSVDPETLSDFAEEVANATLRKVEWQDLADAGEWRFDESGVIRRSLGPDAAKLILKDSISPIPLHKTLVLLEEIEHRGDPYLQRYGRLALAKALVTKIGNLKFGPEVGVGKIKYDAPVLDTWLDVMQLIIDDLRLVRHHSLPPSSVLKADARESHLVLQPKSINAVITSPPYPNEKDYTRTTRLESVILGLIRDRRELRSSKQDLIRSNTRGVYKADSDDRVVEQHETIQRIARTIEQRRIEMQKTSGFERLYSRVTKLYFGGMARHLASLRPALCPGAKLAYVVGDQASYLRVLIRTGEILADLAESLGYQVLDIDLFRTRPSTVTGDQLREEVVVLEWPGSAS